MSFLKTFFLLVNIIHLSTENIASSSGNTKSVYVEIKKHRGTDGVLTPATCSYFPWFQSNGKVSVA